MTQVTLNGRVYSDDGSAARDMQGGGVRNWLLPMMSDAVVEINIAKAAQTYASQASAYATQAQGYSTSAAGYSAAINGTSTTSVTIDIGSKTFNTQTYKQFSTGQYIVVARTSAPSTRMYGQVTSYNATTGSLVVDVQLIYGSGTFSDWSIGVAGDRGVEGPPSRMYYTAKTSGFTASAADMGKMFDCSGTFSVSFVQSATLADGWFVYLVNSGTGLITLDPYGSELIDSAASAKLPPGYACMIECNGSALRTVWSLPQQDSSPALAQTGDYAIDYTDRTIVCSPSGVGQVVTLPSAAPMLAGTGYLIINRSASYPVLVADNTGYPAYAIPVNRSVQATLETAGTQAGTWRFVESTTGITGGVIMSGSLTTLQAARQTSAVQPLGSNNFLVASSGASAGTMTFCVATVSGLTISVGAAATLAGYYSYFIQLVPVGSSFVAIFQNGSTSKLLAVAMTVSGTTVTLGSAVELSGAAYSVDAANGISLTTALVSSGSTAVAVYTDGTASSYAVAMTVSGTTITAGTPVQVWTSTYQRGYSPPLKHLTMLSSTVAVALCVTGANSNSENSISAVALTLSGTTITVGTPLELTATLGGGSGTVFRGVGLAPISSSTVGVHAIVTGIGQKAVVLTHSAGTLTAGTVGALAPDPGSTYWPPSKIRMEFRSAAQWTCGNGVVSLTASPSLYGGQWAKCEAGVAKYDASTVLRMSTAQSAGDEFAVSAYNAATAATPSAASDYSEIKAGMPTLMDAASPQAYPTGTREMVVFNGASCSAYVLRWSV